MESNIFKREIYTLSNDMQESNYFLCFDKVSDVISCISAGIRALGLDEEKVRILVENKFYNTDGTNQ